MPTLLVIRLHPDKAVSPDLDDPNNEEREVTFPNDYLPDLSITAYQLSFADPSGTEPGSEIGTATYLPPNLPPSPSPDPAPQPDPNTGITQHFWVQAGGGPGNYARTMYSVATAVIEVPDPPPGGEFDTADIRLVITRGGNEIVHRQLYYNVPVAPGPMPANPNEFPGLSAISLYLELPRTARREIGTTVPLPEDGSPPNFDTLRPAVESVLNAEPGPEPLSDIANLSFEQARHVAREIAWNPRAYPLPEPDLPINRIYTGPHDANSDEERERQVFEGDLLTYYVGRTTESDRLTGFVFSLSAAIWCERQSAQATRVGFTFPVFPSTPNRRAKVNLIGVPDAAGNLTPLNPAPVVPAAYFYALAASLPHQIDRQQRFDMAVLDSESESVSTFSLAIANKVIEQPAGVNLYQAARRLQILGQIGDVGTPEWPPRRWPVPPPPPPPPPVFVWALFTGWLNFPPPAIDPSADIDDFWMALDAGQTAGHLEVLLCAVTRAHVPLIRAIRDPAFGVASVADLEAKKTIQDWQALLSSNPDLLPPFTAPGSPEERIEAFIRNLRHFFEVRNAPVDPPEPGAVAAPLLPRSPDNLVDALIKTLPTFNFANWDPATLAPAVETILPGDPRAQAEFIDWLTCIRAVIALAPDVSAELQFSAELRFSVIEALWARGFITPAHFEGLTLEAFRDALRGSIAYDHAQAIWDKARAAGAEPAEPLGPFAPVNPDGLLINCIPPEHLSPLGPVAYLKDLLRASEASTCDEPMPEDQEMPLSAHLAERRGPLGDLLASHSNLCVPIPLIDIVNEYLELLVARPAALNIPYNTGADSVGGHTLNTARAPATDAVLHDAATLFEALPEHSTPATPTAAQGAWDVLRTDFSACNLPYHQPLDVVRSYLGALGTDRYTTMRAFRRDITELVLDPALEPQGPQGPEFQTHLWRYPVRHELALEYLGITPEEHAVLYSPRGLGPRTLPVHYGFPGDDEMWTDIVVRLPEFLDRTCLTYCEFRELWQAEFVRFTLRHPQGRPLPDCEPCCLNDFTIVFTNPADPVAALKLLNAFIRLWRKLNARPRTAYSFATLADIANVLDLFNGTTANPDFVRQLAAFQMLRDDFGLALSDGTTPAAGAAGADRTHLLAFWVPGAAKRDWAIDHLLYQIQQYAISSYGCRCRPPEFIKLLRDNLEPLSRLAGFDPDTPGDTWEAHPTHTLRLAEILAKIYASDFGVGEILFLFTADPQLQGGDPFPLQGVNEARDLPFGLPDDEPENDLFALRESLRAVDVDEDEAAAWTFAAMGTHLHGVLGMPLPPDSDRWPNFGRHFFPEVLIAEGIPVTAQERRYETPLAATSRDLWNTPPDGPFHYGPAAAILQTDIPLTDAAVIAKLARIRQLTPAEQVAVSDLYHQPRAELAFFSFLFDDQHEAVSHLIEETDVASRWRWFQKAFARFIARCRAIAYHLAGHLDRVTGRSRADGAEAAMLILKHLRGDENRALTPWEDDNGQRPSVTWLPAPNGGAFHALLGVVGTGMLAEYRSTTGQLRWREARGGTSAFGCDENAAMSPLPTLIPAMNATLTKEQLRFAAIRNGFALANDSGQGLGGAEPFILTWSGLLLIETTGAYGFSAGAPTADEELPDFRMLRRSHRWRVTLQQGQKSWVLLAHAWPAEEAPGDCVKPIRLERGFYELTIAFKRLPVEFDGPEDLCPQTTGFQLKYDGPDSGDVWRAIPNDKLFIAHKSAPLDEGLDPAIAGDSLIRALRERYVPTVRDIRRTYQRAFKAMLFAHRLGLGVRPAADSGQSELGYMLSQPQAFRGQSYVREGAGFVAHQAHFDFNFWPVLDVYFRPLPADDQRAAPSRRRMAALFDWWERLFDYTAMRAATECSPETPVWLLFHESAETHEDHPAHLLRHLGVDIRHGDLVLRFYDNNANLVSDDLIDDRWAIRVWRADLWLRALNRAFLSRDILLAEVFLWASSGPDLAGIANLTRFYRDGCIENGAPYRYKEIKALNDGLRERGRAALIAYLTKLDRTAFPWGGFASEARDLSELLLLDVEAGICQKASRIEEAVSSIQLFVNRARLGLEPGFLPGPAFTFAWDRRFAAFRVWQACRRREIYRESWIEWDEHALARKSEAFRFLASELRRGDLILPVPGGLPHWPTPGLPPVDALRLLQKREPATMHLVVPPPGGIGLLGTPDRHARTSWLAPVTTSAPQDGGGEDPDPPIVLFDADVDGGSAATADLVAARPGPDFPMWFEAAVRLGTRFLRIAAASTPPAGTGYWAKCSRSAPHACCPDCGKVHPALIDEYYFWVETSEGYDPIAQVAEWGAVPDDPVAGLIGNPEADWHRSDALPNLLEWAPVRIVHLHWCRVHNGEFQTPRQSAEGVRILGGIDPALVLTGRTGDSLSFTVTGAIPPEGLAASPPGFRYDIASDNAITLPELVDVAPPAPVGGLPGFPYFAWACPGAPILPRDLFAPVLSVAMHLATHCRYEEALKWLELSYRPLESDNIWSVCDEDDDTNDGDGGDDSNDGDDRDERGPVLPEGPEPDMIAGRDRRGCCCPSDPVSDSEARRRAILMAYLDILANWTDALMAKNAPEAFQRARLLTDTTQRLLGAIPKTVIGVEDPDAPIAPVAEVELACAPLNPRLMCLYQRLSDQRDLIHACLNVPRLRNGTPNRDMPYFGNDRIRACWKIEGDICLDEAFWCRPASPYRFLVLIQRAQELTAEVRGLGAQLLTAYEKGDAEYLSQLRMLHERQINDLTLQIRQAQWREADWQLQALQKAKAMALARLRFYQNLIAVGLLSGEAQYEPLTVTSTSLRTAAGVVDSIGQAMNLIPDPNIGFPANFLTLPPGKKLAAIFAAAGTIVRSAADIVNTVAGLGLTKDGWERREDEWQHQVDVLTIEVEQIERQILAAERRCDIALRELNNHRQVMDNTAEVHDFLRDKLSNHTLYLWMQKETAALHYKMYELALHCAYQAERAFNFERGQTACRFVPADAWDSLHEGLLSGERLGLALRQMEKAYYDRNVREYEITKHISLRQEFPAAFLQLQAVGTAEIEVPEWLFDLDYPGHYMRRTKSLSISIPCAVGPYTGIHCQLTLLNSTIRVSPALKEPGHQCCADKGCNNGYPSLDEDDRFVRSYAAREAIATSNGQSDPGIFELSFADQRYLPFEFTGAVSRWLIELPPENNRFDFDQLSDVVLHLRYTAREGGELLRGAASACTRNFLPGNGIRFIDVKRELTGAWRTADGSGAEMQLLGIALSRAMFPFLTGNRLLSLDRLEILFEAPAARPSTHHTLTFYRGQHLADFDPSCRDNVASVRCVGDAAWPGYYHGVLKLDPSLLEVDGWLDLGVFVFPLAASQLCNVYLLAGYDARSSPDKCSSFPANAEI